MRCMIRRMRDKNNTCINDTEERERERDFDASFRTTSERLSSVAWSSLHLKRYRVERRTRGAVEGWRTYVRTYCRAF